MSVDQPIHRHLLEGGYAMRLGVTGMIPHRLERIDERIAHKIAALGFTGVGMHLSGDPHEVSAETCHRARDILAERGLGLIQFFGCYPSIISPDETVRREGVRIAQDIVRVGANLGAMMIGIRPTSLNPNGPWWPHPDNFSEATEARLIHSLREISSASERYGVPLALECHVTTTLDSPKSVKRIVEQVGSRWVKVNLDPINFIGDLRTAYNSTALIHDLFDTLGSYIIAAHIKDVCIEDLHVVHISETIPGEGIFDFDTFFQRFEALLPDGYGLIEHLPESQIPQAKDFVMQKLQMLGIAIADQHIAD
jgi:sugar phosphate isomerase/epimerase